MDVLTAILAVFAAVGTWLIETLPDFFALFYVAETGLTFLGTLGVAGLAFSVVFLCIGIIQGFLHFRGITQIRIYLPSALQKLSCFFG